jgi:hypothetical protein
MPLPVASCLGVQLRDLGLPLLDPACRPYYEQ